ncbi:hypothetical protein SAMN02745181_0292 [Rubritalea squalenifaciens DSM 18772]|uniref:Lipoprotein n=1 Tax=Rubritalea squalenifaciens DSM 18772 TaxID=1123071 RepID=A0A1M6BRJ9_9BACT|nr:hypothetical protein [Rubritalea squalenifaciens]SHI51385.1 hypothetical protein SAMN02745181_0292 [Rubritalea squalenifaciens DSM 18772]
MQKTLPYTMASMLCCVALLTLTGCNQNKTSSQTEVSQKHISPENLFRDRIENDHKIVFADTLMVGAGGSNFDSIEFLFYPGSKVIMKSYAYSIVDHSGTYQLDQNQELTIHIPKIDIPTLVLAYDKDRLILKRKDGLREFKGYWNIYPEAIEKLFPLEEQPRDTQ